MTADDLFTTLGRGTFENIMDKLEKSIDVYYKVFKDNKAKIDGKEAFAYAYVFGYIENAIESVSKNFPDLEKKTQRDEMATEFIETEMFKRRIKCLIDKITDL